MDQGLVPRADEDRRIDIELGGPNGSKHQRNGSLLGTSASASRNGRNEKSGLNQVSTHREDHADVKLNAVRRDDISTSQEEKRNSQLAGIPQRMPWGKAARPKAQNEGGDKAA